ncbi:MAG: copper chaperone CopZ [Rickettsiales bacterium]|jgi:copper chaperone CopZ
MFKKFISILALVLLFNTSLANAKMINVDVNGLVCEFCAFTIEKNFMKQKEIIEKVGVDLAAKKVFLNFKEGKDLSDEQITSIITNNGYNVVKINR